MAAPEQRLYLREIQRRVGTTPGTASRELGRLVAAGLVERMAEGSQVYFRPAGSPFADVVRSLVLAAPDQFGQDVAALPVEAAGAQASRPPDIPGSMGGNSSTQTGSGTEPLAWKVSAC